MTEVAPKLYIDDLNIENIHEVIHELPMYNPEINSDRYYFDPERAYEACCFYPEILTHVEGDIAGKPLDLSRWQYAIIANIFGWYDKETHKRRYRTLFLYVPRKNSKTTFAAGLALQLLFCDKEARMQIYSAASDSDQAKICHGIAKSMIENDDELYSRAEVFSKSILHTESNSFYKAITSKSKSKHGYNVHGAIIDELHAIDDQELVDVLVTATVTQKEPLIAYTTTADEAGESVCNDEYEYARKVRDAIIEDDTYLPAMFEADIEDDWTDEETWKKANPNYGISVSYDYLSKQCIKAQNKKTFENTFKRLHLNIQVESAIRWLSISKWDACPTLPEEEFKKRPAFGGLDLGLSNDLTAFCLCFPPDDLLNGVYGFKVWLWAPRERAQEREKMDRVPYVTWAREGHMTLTDGETTDLNVVKKDILAIAEEYDIRVIGADRWRFDNLWSELADELGEEKIEGYGQGYKSMSPPSRLLEDLLAEKRLDPSLNKVQRWMASNACVLMDDAENIKPTKKKSKERIDGIVAMIMALGEAMVCEDTVSVYSKRGIVIIEDDDEFDEYEDDYDFEDEDFE